MKRATSAGGIVIKTVGDKKKVLLIIFGNNTRLGFPKGTIGEGEDLEKAAVREVKEETGLSDLKIIKKLGVVTRPATQDDGTKVIKDIHIYLMETSNYNHLEKTGEDYGWFTIEEGVQKMGFPQEAEFLRNIRGKI